jgi:hypothetical protein
MRSIGGDAGEGACAWVTGEARSEAVRGFFAWACWFCSDDGDGADSCSLSDVESGGAVVLGASKARRA